jgi:hypothetical protein
MSTPSSREVRARATKEASEAKAKVRKRAKAQRARKASRNQNHLRRHSQVTATAVANGATRRVTVGMAAPALGSPVT